MLQKIYKKNSQNIEITPKDSFVLTLRTLEKKIISPYGDRNYGDYAPRRVVPHGRKRLHF